MNLHIRAQHTTTRLIPGASAGRAAPRYLRVVAPARDGDAHLVSDDLETLCGLDARAWKRVTSQRWVRLGAFQCPACDRAVRTLAPAT